MEMKKPANSIWTDEQWEAIATRGNNTLVAAAAGSGKTAVLVERIIKMITDEKDPIDVDRLLVVTFTKAAASEMRQRIGEAIEKELGKRPSSLHLRRQLTLLNRATITTLHSFCMEILQRYSFRIDLDPAFRIADDTEALLLQRDVMENMLEAQYEQADEDSPFAKLVESYGGDRDDLPIKNLILSIYEFSRSHPSPDRWLEEVLRNFQDLGLEKINQSSWFKSLMEDVALELKGVEALLKEAEYYAESPGGPAVYIDTLKEDLAIVNGAQEVIHFSWEETYRAMNFFFGKLKSSRSKDIDKEIQQKAKDLRDDAKKRFDKVREELFSIPPQVYIDNLKEMAPLMEKMIDLVRCFARDYGWSKKEKGLVDFSDLEHFALQILLDEESTTEKPVPSEAAMDYQAQFREVLVDEYQDTNMVQETLLTAVCKNGGKENGNLFMVGDVKQSIYRFRLAEPALFMGKYRLFSKDGQGPGKRIDLAKNFRSRKEVLDGVNFIFKQLMSETVGEMEYDESAELIPGATYYPDPGEHDVSIEVMLIDRNEENVEQLEEESVPVEEQVNTLDPAELETVQLESRLIADQIIQLIGRNSGKPYSIYDKKTGEMRPLTYRDVVILLRATSAWAPVMIEEFKLKGIPAYAEFSSGYFEATEVEIMVSLLRIIDNPIQDIPLAAVLRSPFLGLKAEEMAMIRTGQPSGTYYEALQRYVRGEDDEGIKDECLRQKLNDFLVKLESWRTEARQGALASLIWQIYRETGYFDFVGGLPGGRQRQANLRALYDRACQYESTSFRGLFRFLRFIEKMQDQGGDMGTARALGEQEDVVRVMTIHKSKGLEFPVVFVAGLGKRFNFMDLNGNFLLHKELGFGPKYVDSDLRVTYPSLPHIAIKRRLLREQLAEEMRILYVALTRARDKLFITGTVKKLVKSLENWAKTVDVPGWNLPDYEMVKGRTFLDWMGPALVRHQDIEKVIADFQGSVAMSQVREHPSRWKIHFIHQNELGEGVVAEQQLEVELEQALASGKPAPLMSSYHEEVNHRLNWQYAYPGATQLISKLSVSELKRRHEMAKFDTDEPEEEKLIPPKSIVKRPRFMREEKIAPNERGTIMHVVMQYLPLTIPLTKVEVQEIVEEMVEKDLLLPSEVGVINVEQISAFLYSPLGERIMQSPQVFRELPFTLALPAHEVLPHWKETGEVAGEHVLIQGVIDCMFQDRDGWILLDYKTDRTGAFSDDELQERYQVQLDYYGLAMERILQQPIKEKLLYFFDGDRTIVL